MDPVLYALLNGKVTSVDTKVEAMTSGFTYKGSVSTKSNLPSGASKGDVYTVTDEENQKYAWNGSEWINISTQRAILG
jgi:hypothetical protein